MKREGKRHGLLRDEEQLAWLDQKAMQNGFAIGRVRVMKEQPIKASTSSGHRATLHATRYDGLLSVLKPELFVDAVQAGVGSGKAYGFGLLSVAPP